MLVEGLHAAPPLQSALVAQLVLHAPLWHAYSPQSAVAPAAHVPAPSHVEAATSESPWQLAAPHEVPCAGYVHPSRFVPSHVGPHGPDPPCTHDLPAPFGAPLTTTHTPGCAASPHHSHAPLHTVWQQTPSTQLLLAQSSAARQLAPSASGGMHVPPVQW